MKKYYTYLIDSPKSDYYYVGMTTNINKRFSKHKTDSRKPKTFIQRWLNKHQKATITILDEYYNESECIFGEIWYIELFKSWGLKLMNLTEGGEGIKGYKHTTKAKNSISSANKGKIQTQETKNKISKANLNKTYSPLSKNKMSECKKGIKHFRYKQHLTEDHKNKLSKSNTRIMDEIKAYTLEGVLVDTFENASEAKNKLSLNINTGDILKVCRGKQKSCGGYIFQFSNDDNINNIVLNNINNKRLNNPQITQYSLDGVKIQTFINSYQAEKELLSQNIHIRSSDMRACCIGKQKTAGGYVWKFEETDNKMKCKICNTEVTHRQMAMHLKWSHNTNTKDYVDKFGEFREKVIKKDESTLKCQICNESFISSSSLMHHLGKKHQNISKEEYIIQYFYNNVHPLCKCGCNNKVKILTSSKDNKFHRDYIKGHWDWVKPGFLTHTDETKSQMRMSAIKRIENEGTLYKGVSELEKEFRDFIISLYKNEITFNDTQILNGRELDIYLPDLKLAIEFNGTYYHSTKFKDKNYHLSKTKECNSKGIKLIHIWDTDWIYKKNIIKSIILNEFKSNYVKIYARKCVLKEISSSDACKFLTDNHLQGNVNAKYKYGLFYSHELVSIMTFGPLRKNLGQNSKEDHYELLRFCNRINTSVIGGASKLFSHFVNKHKPRYIISYANRDWSEGNLYRQLKMVEQIPTPVGYSYYKSKIRYNRFNFRKDILVKEGYDPLLTEEQIMDIKGYYKVYNTGNLKFIYNGN